MFCHIYGLLKYYICSAIFTVYIYIVIQIRVIFSSKLNFLLTSSLFASLKRRRNEAKFSLVLLQKLKRWIISNYNINVDSTKLMKIIFSKKLHFPSLVVKKKKLYLLFCFFFLLECEILNFYQLSHKSFRRFQYDID